MRENCTLCENGKCQKWRKNGKCVPTTLSAFDKRLEICEVEEVCEKSSIFGNSCFFITDEDIELLKSGKVLFDIDEYGTFIAYKKGGEG